jgi:endonuclease YncB( thermonuclease family)
MRRISLLLGMLLLMSAPPCLADKWRMHENCTLVPNESNDGDSFHVKVKRTEYIFRLYFADCAETDDSVPDRVKDQAEYWGISEKAAIRLGKDAAKFTRKYLENGFTVWTQMHEAMGRSDKNRYYAVVMVGEKNLAEELVRNGLARIFGQDTDLPDGTKSTTFWWRLKTAEREAKKNRVGAFSPDIETAAEEANPNAPQSAVPVLAERDVILAYSIPVFSLKEPFQQVGQLQRGAQVRVLSAVSATMVRVRFAGTPGQMLEAQCRRVDVGM